MIDVIISLSLVYYDGHYMAGLTCKLCKSEYYMNNVCVLHTI